MATIIQNLKNEIVMSVRMYNFRVETEPDDTESVEMWHHYIDQIRTTIFVLWSAHAITEHAYDDLTDFLREQVRDTDLFPKTL